MLAIDRDRDSTVAVDWSRHHAFPLRAETKG